MLFYSTNLRGLTILDSYGKIFIPKMKSIILDQMNESRYIKGTISPVPVLNNYIAINPTGFVEQNPNTYNKKQFKITFFHGSYRFDKNSGRIVGFKATHTHLKPTKVINNSISVNHHSVIHPIPLGKIKVRGFKGSWYKGSRTI